MAHPIFAKLRSTPRTILENKLGKYYPSVYFHLTGEKMDPSDKKSRHYKIEEIPPIFKEDEMSVLEQYRCAAIFITCTDRTDPLGKALGQAIDEFVGYTSKGSYNSQSELN